MTNATPVVAGLNNDDDWYSEGSECSIDESHLAPGLLAFVDPDVLSPIKLRVKKHERARALKRFAQKYTEITSKWESRHRNIDMDDGKERASEKKRLDIVQFYENDAETKWFDPNFVKSGCEKIGINKDIRTLWLDPTVWGYDYWVNRDYQKSDHAWPSLLNQFSKMCDKAAEREKKNRASEKVRQLAPRSVQQQQNRERAKLSRASTHTGIPSSTKHNIGKHLPRAHSDAATVAAKKAVRKISGTKRSGDRDADRPEAKRRRTRWGGVAAKDKSRGER